MKYTYAITVAEGQISAQALMQVKKLSGLSLSEIKERVARGLPLIECDCADEEGMELLLELYAGLDAQGVEATFLDCGDPAPIQYLRNALDSYRELDEQEYD